MDHPIYHRLLLSRPIRRARHETSLLNDIALDHQFIQTETRLRLQAIKVVL
jgi:hypothetical protein